MKAANFAVKKLPATQQMSPSNIVKISLALAYQPKAACTDELSRERMAHCRATRSPLQRAPSTNMSKRLLRAYPAHGGSNAADRVSSVQDAIPRASVVRRLASRAIVPPRRRAHSLLR
eukprot:6178206-Pleurochrysis_carterae.AAC.5